MKRLRFGVGGLTGAAIVCALAELGCYRVHIDESWWLKAEPTIAADRASLAEHLSPVVALTPLTIAAPDGIALVGVAATRPDAVTTILFFGASNFVISKQGPATLAALTAAGPVNVVLMDYRGYGASGGQPTMVTLKADALTVYDYVATRRDLAPAGVVVHGHSIGSFLAAAVAVARPVRGLVLQGSGTTPQDWIRYFWHPAKLKWWARPAYPFIRVSVDTALATEDNSVRVRQFHGPLLLLTGTADTEADPAMSRALFVASASPDSLKRLVVLVGSGHEDMFSNPEFARAFNTFVRLLSTVPFAVPAR